MSSRFQHLPPEAREEGARARVGISGSYGGMNLGDEAILESMVTSLRSVGPVEITVFSRNPEHTLAHHEVDRSVPVLSLSRREVAPEVARLDLLLLGGGGILYDAHARGYLREVALAGDMGVPVMAYAVGAGPLERPEVQALVREHLARARAVTVRDHTARRVLEEAGVEQDILVTADPALLLAPAPVSASALADEGLLEEGPLIGFSVREPGPAAPDIDASHYHRLLAEAADYLVDRLGARIVFVPMERGGLDLQHSHAVIARMRRAQHAFVFRRAYGPGQMLSLVGRFQLVVGMRLHFLLFALVNHVPFVALPYAPKVAGLLEELGDSMPPLAEISAGQLLAQLDEAWDDREHTRARLAQALPALRARAERNGAIALQFLHEGAPPPTASPAVEEGRSLPHAPSSSAP